MRFGNIFSCFIHYLLPSISMIESVFLFPKKQWQIYLSYTMVNANDTVLDITKNSIQPIESMVILGVIYLSFTTVILSFMILNVVYHLCLMLCLLIEQVTASEIHFVVSLSSFGTALNLMNCG